MVDLAKESMDESLLRTARFVAFHLPMHTATRLAAPVIRRARAANPDARICAYGLYAPLNAEWLRSLGVNDVVGGEFEAELTEIALEACGVGGEAADLTAGLKTRPTRELPRLRFLVPDRAGLPPLERYSTLRLADGTRRIVGYTEASRGCRHLCRHCPVVPVYEGQFRVVPADVVLADIAAQVRAGAGHITFGDPDFFNGPTHAMRIVEALHDAHPALTYDVTIKVEHLLQHRARLTTLKDTGCLFVTSAVESIDDRVLGILDKGHTRQGFLEAVALCRHTGVTLQPTFVAFHPWTTLESYCELLDVLAGLDLVDHVAPIQLAIRLLVPEGSKLLELEEVRRLVGAFDPKTLTYKWVHVDPRVDALQEDVARIVGRRLVSDRRAVFEDISTAAHDRAGLPRVVPAALAEGGFVPYRDEPWYCCAEPNPEELTLV